MSDPFGIYKADKKKDSPSGATIAGAGATTAGVGYLAGGRPRGEPDLNGVNFTEKPKNTRQLVGDKVKVARSFAPGGILGFRTKVHEGGLYQFRQNATKDKWDGPAKTAVQAFKQGRNTGKIAPEEKVIRHMRGGRKAAHAALAGGAGAALYGAGKHRSEVKKADSQTKKDALVGAGTAGAGISGTGGALLSSQRRKWSKTASKHVDAAGKLAPTTAGRRTGRISGRRTMDPSVTDGAIVRNKLLDGLPTDVARKVGEHRGAAAQARHFAHVYGNTGKVVALGGGAASAAALYHGKKDKNRIKKSLTTSAFGVDHG